MDTLQPPGISSSIELEELPEIKKFKPFPLISAEKKYIGQLDPSEAETFNEMTILRIKQLMESDTWRNLRPNYPLTKHLLPMDFKLEDLQLIMNEIASHYAEKDEQKSQSSHDLGSLPNKITLSNGAELKKSGSGEQKKGYIYSINGKRLHVLVSSTFPLGHHGLGIPQDPKITIDSLTELYTASTRQNYLAAEYSDPRTYLAFPLAVKYPPNLIGAAMGISIQEYGGEMTWGMDFGIEALLAKIKVNRHIKDRWELSNSEFGKPQHFLNPSPGKTIVIDIGLKSKEPVSDVILFGDKCVYD